MLIIDYLLDTYNFIMCRMFKPSAGLQSIVILHIVFLFVIEFAFYVLSDLLKKTMFYQSIKQRICCKYIYKWQLTSKEQNKKCCGTRAASVSFHIFFKFS